LFESDGKENKVKSIALTSGKKLLKLTVDSVEKAMEVLEENKDDYVWITYDSISPLTAKDMAGMRKTDAYCGITVVKRQTKSESERKGKTDRQLFEMFYEQKKNEKPSEEIVEMFLRAIAGEEI
jgi:hypothetical protein